MTEEQKERIEKLISDLDYDKHIGCTVNAYYRKISENIQEMMRIIFEAAQSPTPEGIKGDGDAGGS